MGEAVVGYAGVYLIVELNDADGQPVKGGVVSFSSKVLEGSSYTSYGEFDVNSVTTGSDGRAFVTYSANSGSGAVDNPTTPIFENVEVIEILVKPGDQIKENDKLKNEQLQMVTELNGSIRDLLITNSQNKFIDILVNKDLVIRRKEAEAFFLNSFPKPAIEAIALFVFGMFGAILFSTSPENNSIPTLAAIALASQKLLPSLQNIYACWATINSYISGFSKIV